jgi:ATP-dependent exoDNAse (exonuclease V) beta subunit
MEIKNIDLKSSLYNNVLLSTNNKFDYFKTLFDNVDGDFFKVATKLIISTNFYQYVKSMSSPEIAEENVNEFIFWMNELSLENPSWTMTDFLLYIDDLNINKIQVKSPNISFEDAVEISTIHSVKGAASSIVILAFTDSRIIANKPQISFNANLGFGIKYYDTQKRTLGTTPFKEQIDDLNAKNDESEEFRLLYVALTRARDRLFIIGKGDAKSINNSLLGFILNNLQDQNIPKSSLFDIRNVRLNF